MVSKVNSIGLEGLEGYVIEVETDTRPGNETRTDVVGLPDASVKEAMNRVSSAIYNNRLLPFVKKVQFTIFPFFWVFLFLPDNFLQ